MFNAPLLFAELERLSRKTFSDGTMKKIYWVTNMYYEWRESRNLLPNMEFIHADLDDVLTLAIENLSLALSRFMTEVCKLDGSEFPGKTMYEIVLCIQFYLETCGFRWKLVDDEQFRVVSVPEVSALLYIRCLFQALQTKIYQ